MKIETNKRIWKKKMKTKLNYTLDNYLTTLTILTSRLNLANGFRCQSASQTNDTTFLIIIKDVIQVKHNEYNFSKTILRSFKFFFKKKIVRIIFNKI